MVQLSQNIKEVLVKLKNTIPTTICWGITGSISLNLNGDINREINDIDIAITKKDEQAIIKLFKSKNESNTELNVGNSYDCYSTNINGIKIDFLSNTTNIFEDVSVIEISDIGNFTILKSKHSIKGKENNINHYITKLYKGDNLNDKQMNNLIKHLNDINSFNQNKKVGYIGKQINLNNIESILKGLPS